MKQNVLILTLCGLSTHGLFSAQDDTNKAKVTHQYNAALTDQLQAVFNTTNDQNYPQRSTQMEDLVVNGADPNVEKEKSPLLAEVVRRGDLRFARCLIDHKANANHLTNEGLNLLHKSINCCAEPRIFAFLCNAGVNPNQKLFSNQYTPLHYLFLLSKFQKTEPIDNVKHKAAILIWSGADDQSENAQGETPLIIPDNLDFISQMMAIGTVIPQVQAAVIEEEAQRRQTLTQMLTQHVQPGPANIVIDYTRKHAQAWRKRYWPRIKTASLTLATTPPPAPVPAQTSSDCSLQ